MKERVWTKYYSPPMKYSDWHQKAWLKKEPNLALIDHHIKEMPRGGQGKGKILVASNNLLILGEELKQRLRVFTDDRVYRAYKIEDVFDPDRNIVGELIALR